MEAVQVKFPVLFSKCSNEQKKFFKEWHVVLVGPILTRQFFVKIYDEFVEIDIFILQCRACLKLRSIHVLSVFYFAKRHTALNF